jgi:hypothetical protein
LKFLEARSGSRRERLRTLAAALVHGAPRAQYAAPLKRMGLEHPRSPGAWLQQRLLVWGLSSSAPVAGPPG